MYYKINGLFPLGILYPLEHVLPVPFVNFLKRIFQINFCFLFFKEEQLRLIFAYSFPDAKHQIA